CAGTGPTAVPASPTQSVLEPAASTPQPTLAATPAGRVLRYVAFGDSWPEGAHCDGCKTFADLWVNDLAKATGASIDYVDLMGSREPGAGEEKASGTLRRAIETIQQVRDAVAGADVILIATGPNEMSLAMAKVAAGTCGGSDHAACIRALGKTWQENFG